jgi:hypothetical protein
MAQIEQQIFPLPAAVTTEWQTLSHEIDGLDLLLQHVLTSTWEQRAAMVGLDVWVTTQMWCERAMALAVCSLLYFF